MVKRHYTVLREYEYDRDKYRLIGMSRNDGRMVDIHFQKRWTDIDGVSYWRTESQTVVHNLDREIQDSPNYEKINMDVEKNIGQLMYDLVCEKLKGILA